MPKVRSNGIGASILLTGNSTGLFDNISDNQYLWFAYYYDDYGRDTHNNIQPHHKNYDNEKRDRIKFLITMDLRERIYLTWLDGGWHIVVGAIYNIAWTLLIAYTDSYVLAIYAFILKVPFSALLFYLGQSLRSRDSCFFYINLGFSRWKLPKAVMAIDFVLLVILVTTALL